ncbi:hypothetical protein pb186bvf_012024 [Paramecium bursaria]
MIWQYVSQSLRPKAILHFLQTLLNFKKVYSFDTQGLKAQDKMRYFKNYATIRILKILMRGFEILKEIPNAIIQSQNQLVSAKDTASTAKGERVEKKYLVEVSLEKIKLTNKFGRQSLQIFPNDLCVLSKRKRSSLKEDVMFVKVQNEKNIQELNSKIQQSQQSQQLKQISQIIELQAFGPKILAKELKRKRESFQGRQFNFQIMLPLLVLILIALALF